MSYFEAYSYCSLEDYERYKPKRLQITELEVDEFYVFMAALKTDDPACQAIKGPALIIKTVNMHREFHGVVFDRLDDDFRPFDMVAANFRDGLMVATCDPLTSFDGHLANDGYFKPYSNGVYDELGSRRATLPVKPLTLAK